jgi:mutator protein MutT
MKRKANPQIVTAAVIEKDGCILIARRMRGLHAGVWEFPGGTLEEGETYEECLKRELREELSVDAEVGDLIGVAERTYN